MIFSPQRFPVTLNCLQNLIIQGQGMTRKDGLLALLVVVVWGLNFVVIKWGLQYAAADAGRVALLLVAFPAIFVARPKIPLSLLLGYGLTISFGQFAFLFCAIKFGMPAGWPRWCCRRRRFSPSFSARSSLANVCRANSWRELRWRCLACWC
jgi:O-acetylserine/cysteine efflux transporter